MKAGILALVMLIVAAAAVVLVVVTLILDALLMANYDAGLLSGDFEPKLLGTNVVPAQIACSTFQLLYLTLERIMKSYAVILRLAGTKLGNALVGLVDSDQEWADDHLAWWLDEPDYDAVHAAYAHLDGLRTLLGKPSLTCLMLYPISQQMLQQPDKSCS